MNTRYCWESSYTSRELRSSGFKDYLGHFPAKAQKKQQNTPRKTFLIFSEMELSSSNFLKRNLFLYFSCIFHPKLEYKKFLYIRKRKLPQKVLLLSQKKALLMFQEMETLRKYFPLRKQNFLIYWKRHIQKPDIFRTLAYLELGAYSEPLYN